MVGHGLGEFGYAVEVVVDFWEGLAPGFQVSGFVGEDAGARGVNEEGWGGFALEGGDDSAGGGEVVAICCRCEVVSTIAVGEK